MKRLWSYAAVIIMLFAAGVVSAKNITLYSEPKSDSKAAGTVNTETGVTIVYTPKSGEWVKVANPANGDVGWVKSSDLGGNSYNIRLITSGDDTHNYRVYQFGTVSSQYNQQQMAKIMQQLEQQQRMMQKNMTHMFQDMFYFSQPILVPVMIVPESPKVQQSIPAKAPKQQTGGG